MTWSKKDNIKRNLWRKKRRVKLLDYLGDECVKCKSKDYLEFHHLPQYNKIERISKLIRDSSWNKIIDEIKKCTILCIDCHQEEHNIEGRFFYKKR